MSGFIRSKKVSRKRKQPGNEEQQQTAVDSAHFDHIAVVPLNMKNIVPEMVLLGSIKEIYGDHIVVLLPDNLHGYVYACDMNDIISKEILEQGETPHKKSSSQAKLQLSDYFSLGQFVCCSVVSCGSTSQKSNRLRLSIKPFDIYANLHESDIRKGMIMWGYVSAKEDHGYEISFGSKILKGFFKCKRRELKLGQMSFYVINSEASAGRLYLVSDTFGNVNCFDDMPFGSILPGNSVKCLIVDSQTLGNVVKVFNSFDGTISNFHLKNFKPNSINTTIKATVLFIDPLSKRIGLSTGSHLEGGSRVFNGDAGNNGENDNKIANHFTNNWNDINKTAEGTVTHVFQRYGVVMEIKNLKTCGVLTKSWMKIPLEDGMLSENYAVDTVHKIKIIGFNAVDSVYMLSDLPSIINMPFISYDKVEIGSIIKGEILNVSDSSITVEFGGLLRGILPCYLLPSKNVDPKRLLMEHKPIKCRVVECDALKAKILLTSSDHMINDKTPILSCYEMARPGMSFVGFVLVTKENYCVVKFYNNVVGILHKNHTDDSLSGKSFMSVYKRGKIVKAFVHKCIPSEKTLHLTLKDNSSVLLLDSTGFTDHVQPQEDNDSVEVASPSNITDSSELVMNVLSYEDPANDNIKIRLAHNDHFQKIGHKKSHPIPTQQLSDFSDLSLSWYQILKRGGKKEGLDKAVILGRSNNASLVISLKRCFLNGSLSKKLPTKYEDLRIGQTLPGIVINCMPNGVNVLVGFSLVGLLPLTNISNEYISSIEGLFCIGQTILVTVHELLNKSKRFTLMSPFKVASSSNRIYCDYGNHGVGYLESYLTQRSSIEKALCEYYSPDKSLPKIGDCVDLVVKKLKSSQKLICKLSSYSSKCKIVHLDEFCELYSSCKPGQQLQGLVVASDIVESVVYVVVSAGGVVKKKSKKLFKSQTHSEGENLTSAVSNYNVNEPVNLTVASINDHHITCIDTKERPIRTVFYGIGIQGFGDMCNLSNVYAVGQSISGNISKILSNNRSIFTPDNFKSYLLTHGDFEPCKVHNVNGCFVYVHVKATNQLGRVHVSELCRDPPPFSNPLKEVIVGSSLNGAVIGQVEASGSLNRKTFKKHADRLLEMSFIHNSDHHKYDHTSLAAGSKVIAYVKEVQKTSVVLTIDPDVTALLDTIELLNYRKNFDFNLLQTGVVIRCVVQGVVVNSKAPKAHNNTILNVGLDPSLHDIPPLQLGLCCFARVTKYLPHYGQLVKLAHGTYAVLPITEVDDRLPETPQNVHPIKSTLRCVIVDMTDRTKSVIVSSKKSLLSHFDNTAPPADNNQDCADTRCRIMKTVDDFGPVGSIHQGYIKHIAHHYALIMLSFKVTAKVQGQEFFKWFSPQSIKSVQLPALVSVKILSLTQAGILVSIVDYKPKMRDASSSPYLTDPLIDPNNRQNDSRSLLVGKCVQATVQKIDTQLGLHLTIDNSLDCEVVAGVGGLHGLVPLTQVSDNYSQFPLSKFKPSQLVNVYVMAQSRFKNVLICSLRESVLGCCSASCDKSGKTPLSISSPTNCPNYENTYELAADQCLKGYVVFISPLYITVCVSLNVIGVISQHIIELLPQNKLKKIKLGDLLNLKVVRVLDSHHIEVCLQEMGKTLTHGLTSLRTSSKPTKVVVASNLILAQNSALKRSKDDTMRDIAFLNDIPKDQHQPDTQPSDSMYKKPPNQCVPLDEKHFDDALCEEKFIRNRERAIVQGQLETADDYERECLSNPNDSERWIRYVAFVMDTTGDIEQARHTIKRSLNVINYRNENDRFNMWICLLNLENEFGDDQSMDQVYRQASQLCDKKRLLQRLTTIYCASGKLLKAEEIHNLLVKKFPHSKKSWLLYLQFLYQNSRLDDARKLLPRALRVLDNKKHIDCLVKSGLLEFKYGDGQRACSIFDGILKNYPNRIDIWFVLIDQHIKQSNTEFVRDLFERLLSLGLNPKRMKSVFKKYADFEKALPPQLSRFGDVQEKAMEYLKLQNATY